MFAKMFNNFEILTKHQVQQRIDQLVSYHLRCSEKEAWQMVDRGELSGCLLEAELKNLRFIRDNQ